MTETMKSLLAFFLSCGTCCWYGGRKEERATETYAQGNVPCCSSGDPYSWKNGGIALKDL